jgi:hypothetical protein
MPIDLRLVEQPWGPVEGLVEAFAGEGWPRLLAAFGAGITIVLTLRRSR